MNAWAVGVPTYFANTIGYYSGQNSLWETICETSKEGVLRRIEQNGHADEITPEVEETVDFYIHGCLFRGYRPQREIAHERELDLDGLFSLAPAHGGPYSEFHTPAASGANKRIDAPVTHRPRLVSHSPTAADSKLGRHRGKPWLRAIWCRGVMARKTASVKESNAPGVRS